MPLCRCDNIDLSMTNFQDLVLAAVDMQAKQKIFLKYCQKFQKHT